IPLLDYHLRALEKGGLISVLESDKYKRFYPEVKSLRDVKILSPKEKRTLALLRQRIPLSIAMHLLRVGSARHKEIAVELNVPSSTLTYHLKKLTKAGIIEKIPIGEERGFKLKDPNRILKLLIAYRPLSKDMFDRFVEIWRELY
ncbi:MAG: helix-turn-helix domain-containing protein, partial [Thermoplasmata archaeon]